VRLYKVSSTPAEVAVGSSGVEYGVESRRSSFALVHWFSTRFSTIPLPPGDIWQCLEMFLVIVMGKVLFASSRDKGYC